MDIPQRSHFGDDQKLIAAIQVGDARAFESMVRMYSQRLVGFAFTFIHTEELSRDIVSDIFSKIWINRSYWQPAGTVRHYLFSAVRNSCFNHLKHEQVVSDSEHMATEHMRVFSNTMLPDERIEQLEREKPLLDALDTLNVQQRAVLRLRYLENMSFKDVAGVLGISVNAAEQISSRAIKTLKAQIRGA